ncbi:MAG: molybdopterin-dependent oxidoreductase [Nitrospiraceae bacterium]|nr:molybdopterin-dependent oxidoreductase [Nitrospiraceae bacterium]
MPMIKLTVDGKVVEVPAGATILDAANAVGSRVPTLCHDNKLHPFGACRICLVEVQGTPRKFTPSCTTPAADNMVVTTTSPAIIDIRRTVLELLLIKHPLDCPVCDKAGECTLQDLVHEYGLGKPRFDAEKGYLPPDYESPVIERNISRCVLCGKCVRICDEQNGVAEWAFTRRGTKARISTDFDRPLDCEFCGECVEICPVGALTTRQFKYKARSWNLDKSPSVCNYCGCGCPVNYETRDGRIMRVSPLRENYLCSKGRFGWDAVHSEERLATPKVRQGDQLVDCTWDEALNVIATNLNVIKNKRGADAIGGLGSTRTTNEESYLFQKFMRTVVGTNNVDMLARIKVPKGLNSAFFSGELAKVGEHDAVLVLDKNVGELNPSLGIEIVRAVNKFAKPLVLVNDGFNKFNKIASAVIEKGTGEGMDDLAAALSSGKAEGALAKAVAILKGAKSVALIVPAMLSAKEFTRVKEIAGMLGGVTYYPIVRRSNFQGSLDMGVHPGFAPGYVATKDAAGAPQLAGLNGVEMLQGLASGKMAALFIMGDDPAGSDAKTADLLRKAEFLVVQDIYLTETAKLAHVVLPAASNVEKSGTFTNIERRLQRLSQAEKPFAESKPDWEILQQLARKMGSQMQYATSEEILAEIRSAVALYKDLAPGAVWERSASPLAGKDVDLSLPSDGMLQNDVITAERLLFSSGTSISRSKEMATIRHIKSFA